MKKLIETLKNIYKIEELRNRIIYTLGLLLIYRLGSFVTLPGINPMELSNLQSQVEGNGLLDLLNIFSGGAFSNASIFALGIMPYISASIVIQLFGILVPYFQKLQKEGESGRRKLNQWTRYLTIGVLLVQAPAYLINLRMQMGSAFIFGQDNLLFLATATIVLLAGTMFVMWLGEKITDKGIGNGVSLIIMIGIIARLPHSLLAEFTMRMSETTGGIVLFVVELLILFFIFAACIALVQATRKVPVQYAKRLTGNNQYGGARQYIPIKINSAGVIPLFFDRFEWSRGFASTFADYTGFWYNLVFGLMVVAFTYFYTAITVNPVSMSDDMKRNGGFIPGVKPGKSTAEYLDTIMSRITLPGSIFLAILAILPAFATRLGVNNQFALFFGGTSLLILVGVVLDTLKQIESYLLLRHYDGLMKGGRIKGRSGE